MILIATRPQCTATLNCRNKTKKVFSAIDIDIHPFPDIFNGGSPLSFHCWLNTSFLEYTPAHGASSSGDGEVRAYANVSLDRAELDGQGSAAAGQGGGFVVTLQFVPA